MTNSMAIFGTMAGDASNRKHVEKAFRKPVWGAYLSMVLNAGRCRETACDYLSLVDKCFLIFSLSKGYNSTMSDPNRACAGPGAL